MGAGHCPWGGYTDRIVDTRGHMDTHTDIRTQATCDLHGRVFLMVHFAPWWCILRLPGAQVPHIPL